MNSEQPKRLYKYLPSQHVTSVVDNGELLFRNLPYFQKIECVARGDHLEGTDIFKPDNGLTINNLTQNTTVSLGPGTSLSNNLKNPDKLFVFCLSKVFDESLFDEFKCDACIVINDVKKFLKKCKISVRKYYSYQKEGLSYGHVEYYDINREKTLFYLGKMLPFRKRNQYKNQNEYRLVITKKNAFEELDPRLVLDEAKYLKELMGKFEQKEQIIRIGSIRNIVDVKYK